jgi:O-methyltransferase
VIASVPAVEWRIVGGMNENSIESAYFMKRKTQLQLVIPKIIKSRLKDTPIYSYLRRRRANRARRFLEFANLYPEAIDVIVRDYEYSIERDNRDIMQVVNIEECVRYIAREKIEGAFVETGVYTGGASGYALRALVRHEATCSRSYWGYDSFEGMPQPTAKDGTRAIEWMFGKGERNPSPTDLDGRLEGSEMNLSDFTRTKNYLSRSGYPKHLIHVIKGWFQETLPTTREKIGPIAILRMDGDFYESTKIVLDTLYEQVVPGGVIIIDDYGTFFEGCRAAVDEFLNAIGEKPFIHYVDNGVRFFIKPGRM